MSSSIEEIGESPDPILQASAQEIVIETVRKRVQPLFGNEFVDRVVLGLLFLAIVIAISVMMFISKRFREEELYLRSLLPRLPARVVAVNNQSRMEFEVMLDEDDEDDDEDDEYYYDVSSMHESDEDGDEPVYEGYLDDPRFSTMSIRDRAVTSSFYFLKPSEHKLA